MSQAKNQPVATTTAMDILVIPKRPFSEHWLMSLRKALVWQGGDPILMRGFEILPAQAQAILHKRLTLSPRLSAGPNDRALIAIELAKLIAAFPMQGAEETAKLAVDAYLEALAGQPAWAVVVARNEIITGRTKYGKPWGPTPVELGDLVRQVTLPYRNDLLALDGLLAISKRGEPDPEVKEMVSDGFDALVLELGGKGKRAARHEPSFDEIREGVAERLKGYPRVKPKAAPPADVLDEMGYGDTMEPG